MDNNKSSELNKCKKKQDQRQAVQAKIVGILPIIGRPHNPNGKTKLQRQREYRQRVKEQRNRLFNENRGFNNNDSVGEVISLPVAEALDSNKEAAIAGPSNVNNASTSGGINNINSMNECNLYSNYQFHKCARQMFKKFTDNPFGYACSVCDRLWFKNELTNIPDECNNIITQILPGVATNSVVVCVTCKTALLKHNIPIMSTFNGFKYPPKPRDLPPLDFLSERLISPRLPFMQIRRLRHALGQYGIFGQIINVPVDVNTMVSLLPRDVDDDYCINIHIKRKKIHKSSYLSGFVNKRAIKTWLQFLIQKPLYQNYNIKIKESFFNDSTTENPPPQDMVSEDIPIEDSLTADQQTLLWNEEKYLRIAPGEKEVPQSLLFDEHAEELSFPSIYLGEFRTFRDGVRVTPFMMATSELRRSDRRGVTPHHLLYSAMKVMRMKIRDCLTVAFKHVGTDTNITRKQIESEDYVHSCIDTNLAFLKTIPNSTWYWASRKKDLFAMIRQYGKPTLFLTLSANEIGWIPLLQNLYKLKHKLDITPEQLADLHFMEKSTLVNDDAVTCAIYFNKLVNTIVTILKSKKTSPFGGYYVTKFFKRIEFQHRGSPHAHMLLWLNNAPNNPLNTDSSEALRLINELVSVSTSEASGNIKLQTHKHTFTCYKRITSNQPQKCRFEAPFMPCRATSILVPMSTDDPGFHQLKKRYNEIRMNLDFNDYTDIDSFYEHNNVVSDEEYIQILRSGIQRPRVFLKRQPNEKWNNAFNPFLLSILKSNMDIQFITEEYSCAAYVVEYVNKTNRGISNLQRQIIQTMDEHPEFDIVDVTRKMSVDMLNTVEMTSQEAAWYLLREPMSKSSHKIEYIPTVWPIERQRMRKTQIELDKLQVGEDCTNIWKENWFDKYERRSSDLENISLAQFVAYYNIKEDGAFQRRKEPRTIRYRNYDISTDLDNHKREMVTLYIPFQNEETEVLADLKFLKTYTDNEQVIVTARKEFESDLDIEKTMEICRQLCRNDNDDEDNRENVGIVPEPNPFQQLYNDPSAEQDNDLRLALLNKLGPIAKRRENLMDNPQFLDLMRSTNDKQRSLLLHTISHLINAGSSPLQIFFTGPAGCGKTFVIKLLMEIYNRFTDTDGHCNAYITCASTGKAAVAIDGTTVHTALKITLSKLLPLSTETALQYRTLFRYVKVIIIDEVSMIGAELLAQIDQRLKQISGAFDSNFGGYDIILIGDLRQLPPVRATPIYKHPKQRIGGPTLWQSLKFYELNQVMRQSNSQFANILTKIGNGEKLSTEELCLIESRFFTIEEVQELCPNGIRLFYSNQSVNAYNNKILTEAENKVISIATDIFTGYHGVEQLASLRQILHKKSTSDTGGLPYEIIFVVGKYYILTTNTDVSDGLANGAVGKLVYIELNENNEVTRVWLTFPSNKTGLKLRTKAAGYMQEHNIPINAVPINRRSSTIHLNNNKTMNAKRNHFPLISGCAMTIHKSQGGTFEEIVYQYGKNHPQQLLYVALSRVTTIEKLYIVTINNTATFFHGRCEPAALRPLKLEYERLSANPLVTLESQLLEFITKKPGLSIYTFNIQSLRAHNNDIIDKVAANSNILLLSETWTRDDEDISIPNFNCIVKYKRSNIRSGGVAIYQNNNDTTHIVTPSMDISLHHLQSVGVQHCAVGEICAAECKTQNGQSIMLISIYISPNQPIGKITQFIHRSLIPFSAAVAAELNQGLEKQAMILSGDFNINFSSESGAILIDFLKTKFDLSINNNPNEPTTKHGTTIDAVFSRYLHTIETKIFISHFSYHKPLITYVDDRNVNES